MKEHKIVCMGGWIDGHPDKTDTFYEIIEYVLIIVFSEDRSLSLGLVTHRVGLYEENILVEEFLFHLVHAIMRYASKGILYENSPKSVLSSMRGRVT